MGDVDAISSVQYDHGMGLLEEVFFGASPEGPAYCHAGRIRATYSTLLPLGPLPSLQGKLNSCIAYRFLCRFPVPTLVLSIAKPSEFSTGYNATRVMPVSRFENGRKRLVVGVPWAEPCYDSAERLDGVPTKILH